MHEGQLQICVHDRPMHEKPVVHTSQTPPARPQAEFCVPVRHTPASTQPVQQDPPRHVPLFVLQLVPSGLAAPSTHVAVLFAPPGHAVTPWVHAGLGFPGQAIPATHGTHAPPLHPFAQTVSELPKLHRPPLHVPPVYVRSVVALMHAAAGGVQADGELG